VHAIRLPRKRAVVRRVVQALVTLWVASVLVWSMQLFAPGDPALRVLAAKHVTDPTPAQVEEQRDKMGLDGSPVSRYVDWLGGAVRGDLGESWSSGRPVASELADRLPATLILTVAALGLAVTASLMLGCVAGYAPRRWPDALVRAVALLSVAVPSFVVATLLLDVVVVRWGWFQVVTDGTWGTVLLPAVTLALAPAANWTRLLRAGILEARRATFLQVAEARGATQARLIGRHALPNASLPFLTAVGTGTAALLGGAPVVESIYTWPGVGRYAVESITARNVPVVQGFTLLAVAAYVSVSMIVDVVAGVIDPRLRVAGGEAP
jgi:glutathione transport system permease protein